MSNVGIVMIDFGATRGVDRVVFAPWISRGRAPRSGGGGRAKGCGGRVWRPIRLCCLAEEDRTSPARIGNRNLMLLLVSSNF